MSDGDNLFELLNTKPDHGTKTSQINGIVVAQVTETKDPDNMGRIKLKFQWHSEQNVTDYVRVCSLMAGGNRGAVFLPEIGDEVVCAFINGDINRPICLGALYDDKNKPPLEKSNNEKNNIKKIKTRGGHEIVFNDEESNESLVIHSKSGHTIILDDAIGKEIVTIKDKTGNNKIEIDSITNSMSITSALNLDIKAPMINIEASASLNIESGSMLKMKGLPIMLN